MEEKKESVYQYIAAEAKKMPQKPYLFQNLKKFGKSDVQYTLGLDNAPLSNTMKGELASLLLRATAIELSSEAIHKEFEEILFSFPLVYYMDEIRRKTAVLLDEEVIEGEALYKFALQLTKESAYLIEVKYGILLLGAFQNDITASILMTLGLHSEFTLYVVEAVKNWKGGNRFILQLARNTDGYGKAAALNQLLPITSKQKTWMLCQGADNSQCPALCALLILENGELQSYYKHCKMDEKTFHTFSKLLAYGGCQKKVQEYSVSRYIIKNYLTAFEKYADRYIDLAAVCMIMESMHIPETVSIGDSSGDRLSSDSKVYWNRASEQETAAVCAKILERKKWKTIFMNELYTPTQSAKLLFRVYICLVNYQKGLSIAFADLYLFLCKDPFDTDVMQFVLIDYFDQYYEDVYAYLKKYLPDAVFTDEPKPIKEKDLKDDYPSDLWLILLLKQMGRRKYPEETFYLKCLKGRLSSVRLEAAACLKAMDKAWSAQAAISLLEAYQKEPDKQVSRKLKKLLDKKKES